MLFVAGQGGREYFGASGNLEPVTVIMTPSVPGESRTPVQLRVLVVDDCEDNSELLADLVTSLGHDVRVARTGNETLRSVEQNNVHLVLLDLGLPDMDGCEVARSIRTRTPSSCRIVALTGFSDPVRKEKALAAGCHSFIVKPVRLAQLQELLSDVAAEVSP